MSASRLLSTTLCGLASLLCLAPGAPAQHFPAPDPPLLERPPARPRLAPEPGVPEGLVPPSAAAVEWTLHRTPDGEHPNGDEQAVMWLMNRARRDPAAEGVRLATSTEADVADGRGFFMVNVGLLQSEFAALAPKPPAAFDVRLYTAARAHSEDLIARDAQDHVGQFDRVDAAGFDFTRARGSVFAFARSGLNTHAALNIDWGSGDGTGMQPGRGHRQAIMSIDGDYTNAGLAVVPDASPATSVGPLVVSLNYATAAANGIDHFNRFVVGTVWQDLDGNDRYDPGEGLGGVTVTPDRGQFFAVTAAGGGYAIPITDAGDYAVAFAGGGIGASVTRGVTVGSTSVLLDHLVGSTTVVDRAVITAPTGGTVVPLAPGTVLRIAWMPVDGVTRYLLEHTGPGLAFSNPNGTGPDPVNGSGGLGGALVLTGTSVDVHIDPSVPPGRYEVRVIGLSPTGAPTGTFSDAVALHLGVGPDARPALTAPASGVTASRGAPVTLAWIGLPGITRYAIEVVGPNRAFAVPNAPALDPTAAAVVVTGTGLTAAVPSSFVPGPYQVRVIGLTATGQPLGRASDAVTLVVD